MAEKITNTALINKPDDLVTSREQTRAGFIAMALEKNYLAIPYIEEAKALKALASNGCIDSTSKTVTVASYPVAVITASSPLTFCIGDSVTLSVGKNANYTY